MALLSLLFSNQVDKSKIAALELDAAISIDINTTSTVTSNPIEEGADVSDHVKTENLKISLEAIVSESPINLKSAAAGLLAGVGTSFLGSAAKGFAATAIQTGLSSIAGLIANRGQNDIQYPEKSYNYLRELQTKREPFTAVLNGKSYDNLIITSLSKPEKAEQGGSLFFSASFEQIRIVASKTVLIPKSQIKGDRAASAAGKAKLGKQGTTETASKKSSILFKGLKSLGALG